MEKVNQKDSQVFLIELYEKYAHFVYGIAFSILKNKNQAEDVVQDSFIKLMPYLSKIENAKEYQIKSLISRIGKNDAVNKYRRNKRESRFIEMNVKNDAAVIPGIKNAEEREFLKQILEKLDEKSREIIMYRCFYELDYKEIAAVLEISEQAAAKRFERAKKLIKNMKGVEYYE